MSCLKNKTRAGKGLLGQLRVKKFKTFSRSDKETEIKDILKVFRIFVNQNIMQFVIPVKRKLIGNDLSVVSDFIKAKVERHIKED
ncbi:hypothetical protein JCM14244_16800 [Venenivibrio stagnispumantis]